MPGSEPRVVAHEHTISSLLTQEERIEPSRNDEQETMTYSRRHQPVSRTNTTPDGALYFGLCWTVIGYACSGAPTDRSPIDASTEHTDAALFDASIGVDSGIPVDAGTFDAWMSESDGGADSGLTEADGGLTEADGGLTDGGLLDSGSPANTGSLQFDGIDDFVTIPAFDALAGAAGVTVEAWVKATANPRSGAIAWQSRGGPSAAFGMERTALGQGEAKFGFGSTSCTATGGTTLFRTEEWVHVAATWTGPTGSPRLYINGDFIRQSSCSTAMARVSNDLLVGAALINSDVTNHFSGLIDEVRVWSVARSREELSENRLRRLRGDEEGLVGYWTFDEDSGDVVLDQTGSFNGTLGLSSGPERFDPVRVSDTPF